MSLDLPDFSETLISIEDGSIPRGAHEKESIHGRADGRDPARSRPHHGGEAAKKHKVSEPTIYAWRKHFGQLEVTDVKRLKALELENSRLKKLLAERDLDIEVLKEINAKKW